MATTELRRERDRLVAAAEHLSRTLTRQMRLDELAARKEALRATAGPAMQRGAVTLPRALSDWLRPRSAPRLADMPLTPLLRTLGRARPPRALEWLRARVEGYYEPPLRVQPIILRVGAEGAPSKTDLSLADAMRILGFTRRPTVEELDAKKEAIAELNDPDKGGSDYLRSRAQAAAERIAFALRTNQAFSTATAPAEAESLQPARAAQ